MDKQTYENWLKVKKALEAAEKTQCMYYKLAVEILLGRRNPLD